MEGLPDTCTLGIYVEGFENILATVKNNNLYNIMIKQKIAYMQPTKQIFV